jgi:hypothetical protein
MVKTLQVTIPSGGTVQISTLQCSIRLIDFQNNAGHTMRVGDSTVTSSIGHLLAATGGGWTLHTDGYFSYLSDWFVVGTAADVVDVTFVT